MKIKIAFLSSYLPKKGPVKVLLEKIKHIDYSKFEVYIYTFKNEIDHSYLDEFIKFPVNITQIKQGGKFNILKKAKVLQKELDEKGIEIVHSHCLPTLFISVLLRRKVRFNTVHIYPGIQLKKKKGGLIGGVVNTLNKMALRKIEYPICCSRSISEEFKKNDNLDFPYIQNGVSKINYPYTDRNAICQQLGLDSSYRYFISFGRFSKEKNFQFLIEAFKNISDKKFRLIILGDGPLYPTLKLEETESIIIPGFKENIYDYLFISDYYTSSSITEGLPMSVLEAMSMKKPVLLSDIAPHKEILIEDGAGLLYSLNNSDDFKRIIETFKKLSYNDMSDASYRLFKSNFSSEIMSNRYQTLYLAEYNDKF